MRILERYRLFILTVANKYHKFIVTMFFIVFAIMNNEIFGLKAVQNNVESFYMIDMNFYNTKEYIQSYIYEIGVGGRNGYFNLLIIDTVFAIVFTVFQSSLLTKLLMKFKRTTLETSFILLFPLFRGLTDLVENVTMILSLHVYPRSIDILLSLNSFITPMKWILLYISLAIIACLIILSIIKVSIKRLLNIYSE